jgi:hypothetical protein
LIFLQLLQVALTIDGKTSSLSITTEKTRDSPLQVCNMVLAAAFHLTSHHGVFFEFLGQGSTSGSTKKNLG